MKKMILFLALALVMTAQEKKEEKKPEPKAITDAQRLEYREIERDLFRADAQIKAWQLEIANYTATEAPMKKARLADILKEMQATCKKDQIVDAKLTCVDKPKEEKK